MAKDKKTSSIEELISSTGNYIELLKKELNSIEDNEEKTVKLDEIDLLEGKLNGYKLAYGKGEDLVNLGSDLEEAITSFSSNNKNLVEKAIPKKILNNLLNVIQGSSDIKLARNQISESKSIIDSLEEPNSPKKFNESSELKSAIDRALGDISTSGLDSRTAGLRQDIIDVYNKDINSAKIASTGQAGSFGAYSQVASNRKLKNALALRDAKLKLRDLGNRNLNSLIGKDISQNVASSRFDLSKANFDYKKYIDSSMAAGKGLASGRMNLRTGQREILNSIPSIYDTYSNIRSSYKKRGDLNQDQNRVNNQDSYNPQNIDYKIEPRFDFQDVDSILDYEESFNRTG